MLIATTALVVAGMLFWLWRRSGRAIVLVAAIVWLAYPLWEFALQIFAPEVNIRVDLLPFYPILLISGVLGIAFGLASRKSESGSEASCSIPVAARQVRRGAQTGHSCLDVLQWSRQLRQLRSLVGLGGLTDSGQLTEPVDMLVECIEHGLELHLRHLGEHPDILDVPERRVLAASALSDRGGTADGAVCGHLACSMMSRCWERAVNSRSRADCMASSINESANC